RYFALSGRAKRRQDIELAAKRAGLAGFRDPGTLPSITPLGFSMQKTKRTSTKKKHKIAVRTNSSSAEKKPLNGSAARGKARRVATEKELQPTAQGNRKKTLPRVM